MKTKNSDIAVKIFLVVVAVILVGLLIAWSTGVFKDKRNDLNDGTERINKAISSMAEFDLLTYDGRTISGNLLLDLIEENPEGVKVSYHTLAKPTGNPLTDNDDEDINPNGIFEGKVLRDDNGVITDLIFTQEK